ncbi:hypothetical protein NW754_002195 [Fusarium falciforme]|nr:hypothetical protein NW754_002195 [Fusarium falciforme]
MSEEQVQKLNEVSQQLVRQDTNSRGILAVAGEALSAIVEVKDLLVQVSQDVINVRMVFNSMCLRPMGPTDELPAIIEDPLGRRVPIPPEWLDSLDWESEVRLRHVVQHAADCYERLEPNDLAKRSQTRQGVRHNGCDKHSC